MSDQQSVGSRITEFQLYIDGEWVDSVGGDTRRVRSPASGEQIATCPDGTREDAQRAIDAARAAQSGLEQMTAFERAALCDDLADVVEQHHEELTEWLAMDQGKPLPEAEDEVDLVVTTLRDAGEHAKRAETDVIPSRHPDKRIQTIRKPHGVYGVITPWNYPLGTAIEYLAHGLAIGNAVAWVPAPTTTAVCAKFVEVLDETDLPAGALNLVAGEGPIVGNELVVNDGTDAIAFTGSPETGELIAEDAGTKPTVLELGGNGPVIVLDDANLDLAVECVGNGCFTNAGQICTASERILVHEAVKDAFVERIAADAEEIQLGDPFDDDTDMGPLNNADVAAKMDRHVEDAVEKGATVVTGGNRAHDRPTDLYYQPTVLDDVTTEMVVNEEESFGPIAPVVTVSDREEALKLANSIDYGLSMGVFTDSINNMEYFIRRLESGMININDTSAYWEPHTPAGGYSGKKSGHGRYGGTFTIEEMSQVINVTIGPGERENV
ncbi:aldehyde dehydrogenase [Halobacteriales archaeon QS_4_62_28]|nr:MAG: aldehyde dehydrogenase [Halobacteriales archaeon QS_4_62_28]